MSNSNWVQTWGQSHSALSLFYYPSCKKTYRLIINTAISGKKLRFGLSNAYGKSDVEIESVTAAPCSSFGAVSGGFKRITFNGQRSFCLRINEHLTSDEIDFEIEAGKYFCINVYVTKGDLTSGNLLDNVELVTAKGDHSETPYCGNETRVRDSVITLAGKVLGMHLPKPIPLFDSVELLNEDGAAAIVVFGDSVSQQGFWTNPFEKRIREAFPGKYSFINKSVMGNRLLYDCAPRFPARNLYGRRATQRMNVDIFPYSNIEYVILSLGVNDVFEYNTINAPMREKPTPEAICEAITYITDSLHAKGIKVIAYNIPAFGSAPDATREKDALRKVVNNWMAENQAMFDGFFDVSAAATDPNNDYVSRAEFIGPDKLHPNAYGGNFLAQLVDINMFAPAKETVNV